MKRKKIEIVQKEGGPEIPGALIADSIVKISESMRALNSTRLSRRAIVTLISADTKYGHGTIETVLMSLEGLETTWLKPKAAK